MRTPANIFQHPIHPMLVAFPIGLWNFSLAGDLIRIAGARVVHRRVSTAHDGADLYGDQSHYRRTVRGQQFVPRKRPGSMDAGFRQCSSPENRIARGIVTGTMKR